MVSKPWCKSVTWEGNLDSYKHLSSVTYCWGIYRGKAEIQEHDWMPWMSMCFSLAGAAQNTFMVPSRPSCGCSVLAEEAASPLPLKLKASILTMLLFLLLNPTLALALHSSFPSSPIRLGCLTDTDMHLVDTCGFRAQIWLPVVQSEGCSVNAGSHSPLPKLSLGSSVGLGQK